MRWVGTGRTIFNNKGKPVRQYEPFFSSTHLYEPERELTDTGVSPVLFYDPVERVVATLHPNQTYEKVVFDAWRQASHDVNDTVTQDPRTDPDIAGYVAEFFKTQPDEWATWFAQRIDGAKGAAEQDAAQKAALHSQTSTVAHLDSLGRVFLTMADNGGDDLLATRVELDIEGNLRAVIDAKDRIVERNDFDLLGNQIHRASMEAGARWVIADAAGNPIRAWDSRGFVRRTTYDALRRPTGLYVGERLAEQIIYGEVQGSAANHRGQVYQQRDGAGVVTNVAFDFKGNLIQSRRELLVDYKLPVDWLQSPLVNAEFFESTTAYDALNRPITITTPDGSIHRPVFNEANLLESMEVNLRGASEATVFVSNIDYDAKGQRERIEYGNGAITSYEYDPLTYRLMRLRTERSDRPDAIASILFQDSTVIQDLHYSYDPAGNITRIEDESFETIVRNNRTIAPVCNYTYDALYRLVEAKGREQIGQSAFDFAPSNGDNRDYPFVGHRAHPNDLQALCNYTQRFGYDAVGNLESFNHRARGEAWTRHYDYEETSLIESEETNNRLTRTRIGDGFNQIENYTHDAHGNMISMPHLSAMNWDSEDRLHEINLGGGGNAYYVYDSAGQRVRKVIESLGGVKRKERIYLGGFEFYREYEANGQTIELERESLHVMDDQRRIALVETQTVDESEPVVDPIPLQRYQLSNHLGSSSLELDEFGDLISYEEYHPYGTTSFQAGRSAAEVSLKRYRYTAKERDEESGFNYHGARYYAPWLARWTSADPAGMVDGTNLFGYVSGNPIVFIDQTGNQAAPVMAPEPAPPPQPRPPLRLVPAPQPAVPSPPASAGAGAAAGAAEATGVAATVLRFLSVAGVFLTVLLWPSTAHAPTSSPPETPPTPDETPPESETLSTLAPEPALDKEEKQEPAKLGRIYATYTKYNAKTGLTYSGRTSAIVDLNQPLDEQARNAVRTRDLNHHIDKKDSSFFAAVLDEFAVGKAVDYNKRYQDEGYHAIRGREQQLIDYHGARRAVQLGIKTFKGGGSIRHETR